MSAGLNRTRIQGLRMVQAWAFLLPIQVPLLGVGEKRGLQFAPSDVVLLVGLVLLGGQMRIRRGSWSVWHLAVPVLVGFSVLGPGLANRYTVANKLIGVFVLLAAFSFVTSFVNSWEQVALTMQAFVYGAVSVTAITAPAMVTGTRLPLVTCHTPACDRLTGYLPDANLYGGVMVVALAFVVATAGTRYRVIKPGAPTVLVWIVLVAGLFLSLSRSSWIGATMLVLCLGVLRPRRASVFVATALPVVAIVLAVGTVAGRGSYLQTAERTNSIDSRFVIIENAVDAVTESPVFGIGIGQFPDRYDAIVHNTALWFLAELGVLGFVVFVGLMLFVLRKLLSAYRRTSDPEQSLVLGAGLAHGAMLGFSLGIEAFYQRHWWLAMALISVADRLSFDSDTDADPSYASDTASLQRSAIR